MLYLYLRSHLIFNIFWFLGLDISIFLSNLWCCWSNFTFRFMFNRYSWYYSSSLHKFFFSDPKAKWEYNGVKLSPESSITILAGSLQLNKKYQFLVQMGNRRNVTLQATGYVLVQIEDSNRPMIAIGYKFNLLHFNNFNIQF